jgi:hypothetical protein
MSITRTIGLALITTFGLGAAYAAAASRYEEPDYTLVSRIGEVEVRDYGPRLHAEVSMSGDRSRSAGDAFRVLAGYIFSRDTPSGEPIGMTVPVGQYTGGDGAEWSMWFVMPARYTLDTIPPVTDSRIRLVEMPAQRIAALSFSGRMDTTDFSDQSDALLAALSDAGLTPVGPPTLAVYSGPFTPGPLRRNEVLVAVE